MEIKEVIQGNINVLKIIANSSDLCTADRIRHHCKECIDELEQQLKQAKSIEDIRKEDKLDFEISIQDKYELIDIFVDKNYTLKDKISVILNKHDKGIFDDSIDIDKATEDIRLLIGVYLQEAFEAGRELADEPYDSIDGEYQYYKKYETFKDYLKSKENGTTE